MKRILECNVWCAQNYEAEELGIDSGDTWIPIAIKWDAIIAIKQAGENQFLGTGKATIYLASDRFTVDRDYKEILREWEDIMSMIKARIVRS